VVVVNTTRASICPARRQDVGREAARPHGRTGSRARVASRVFRGVARRLRAKVGTSRESEPMPNRRSHAPHLAVLAFGLALPGCGGEDPKAMTATIAGTTGGATSGVTTGTETAGSTSGDAPTTTGDSTSTSTSTSTSSDTTSVSTTLPKLDVAQSETSGGDGCGPDKQCNLLDVLFVIDNSGTMGEEQANLAANFPYLVEKLRGITDVEGNPVNADVNIMVTTTDFGHPLCSPFEKPDYDPAKGSPIATACVDRLERFTGLGMNPLMIQTACTDVCKSSVVPADPFINFDPEMSNVINADPNGGDPVAQALSCIGPQGIDGCGMEAPLETMLQALDPNKAWNQGDKPFLRDGAVLAIVVMTDEAECSVKDYSYFDPMAKNDPVKNQYWEDVVGMPGVKGEPTSATCFNAGVSCVDADADGVYESCVSEEKGVLQPLTRYIGYLRDTLIKNKKKEVIMLGILGVPEVTAHNTEPPYEPIAGGVLDLVYRKWQPGDILPPDTSTPEKKEYEFGIGPGCTNAMTGQAIPNTRVIDVCQSLDTPDDPNTPDDDSKLRCCIESICDDDFSAAIDCLSGILEQTLIAPG
jgi:hypothetical protein